MSVVWFLAGVATGFALVAVFVVIVALVHPTDDE